MGPTPVVFEKEAGDADAHGGRSEGLLNTRVCDPEGPAERRDELSDCGDSDHDGSEDLPQRGVSMSDGSEGDMDLEEGSLFRSI